jgi:integrase/recombinase XerC
LRPFARYLQQFEPATAIPDEAVFGSIPGWLMPHIYRDQEVVDLLAAARGLGPAGDLRAATYETLFGLIASTGLRLSEAVHLLDADVDLMLGLLTVRQTKFNKSRQLPLHPSTTAALLRYRQLRHQYVQERPEAPFFVGTRGKHLEKSWVCAKSIAFSTGYVSNWAGSTAALTMPRASTIFGIPSRYDA